MNRTTLCYIESDGKWLLMHRTKKKNDENAGLYVGLGGHFLEGETPEECVKREVCEESGVCLDTVIYRGLVHFSSDVYGDEDMYLFTAQADISSLPDCDEGELCLVDKEKVFSLPMWAGDRVFLSLLLTGAPVFDLRLIYKGEKLFEATLNGETLRTDGAQ